MKEPKPQGMDLNKPTETPQERVEATTDHRMDQEIGGDAELEAAIKQARQEGLEKDRQARVTQAKETLSKMDPNQLMDVELTDEMREMTKTPQQPKPGLLNKLKSWFSK